MSTRINCLVAQGLNVSSSKDLERLGLGPSDIRRHWRNVGIHLPESRTLLFRDGIGAPKAIHHTDHPSGRDVRQRQSRADIVAVRSIVSQVPLVVAHPGLDGVDHELGHDLGLGLGRLGVKVLCENDARNTAADETNWSITVSSKMLVPR